MNKGGESNDKDLSQSKNVMLFNFLRHMLKEKDSLEKKAKAKLLLLNRSWQIKNVHTKHLDLLSYFLASDFLKI